ncbi:MAG: hypothetical protein CVV42_06500 [Candidatus Riflebacteria bacterium HGW-Riflebacteria-2]|jgi:hypothetical protein|nr:MAG: hypothetical protein CVV42_06500 [Candidatus Riflebacteria bacterium HGW-Riflebacteria-2]
MPAGSKRIWFAFAVISLLMGLGYWLWLSPIAGALDIHVHIRSAWVFYMGLADGLSYPDWDATAYGGRGNSMPRFLGPLPLVVASFFQLMGIEVVLAVKILVVLFAVLGLLGVYYWLASIGLARTFPWAALFFMVNPLISFHLGVAFFFQNLCAYFLSPWLWYAAVMVWRKERRAITAGALVLGFIALSHLYFALMVGYAWFLLMLISWLKLRERRFWIAALAVPVLAMLVAAPYILPAMLTSSEVYYAEVAQILRPGQRVLGCEFIDDPVLDEKKNALPWHQALFELTKSPDDVSSPDMNSTDEIMSLLQVISSEHQLHILRPWLLLSLVLCFILACAGSLRQDAVVDKSHIPLWMWLFVGGCCAIMSLRFSYGIYSILPGAMAVQFPFRWLLPAFGLWLPLAGVAAGFLDTASFRLKLIVWVARILFLVILLLGLGFQGFFWALPDASLKSSFAAPGYLEPFCPRSVPKMRGVPYVAGVPHRIHIASGSGVITDYQSGVAWLQAQGDAHTPVELHINTHYDPGWRLTMSSTGPIQPIVNKNDGTMLLKIPAGAWQLTMERASPAGRTIGWLLMLLSLLIMFLSSRPKQRDRTELTLMKNPPAPL